MTDSERKEQVLREKLTSRASKTNKDIKAGRVYTREEAESHLDAKMKQWK